MSRRLKTGIFGGSFDPLHNGHLSIAQAALTEGGMDEVWLMVSPQNPLKVGKQLTPAMTRLEMARIGVGSLDENLRGKIKVSDFELNLPQPTYSITTLRRLQEEYPDREFHIIIGGDNLHNFNKWREREAIAGEFFPIVYPRDEEGIKECEEDAKKYAPLSVILKGVPVMDISSTRIRRMAGEGEDVSVLVPKGVAEFIGAHGLYLKSRV